MQAKERQTVAYQRRIAKAFAKALSDSTGLDCRVTGIGLDKDAILQVAERTIHVELVRYRGGDPNDQEATIGRWAELGDELRSKLRENRRFAGLYACMGFTRQPKTNPVPKDARFISEFVCVLDRVVRTLSEGSAREVLFLPPDVMGRVPDQSNWMALDAHEFPVCAKAIQYLTIRQHGNHRGVIVNCDAESPNVVHSADRATTLIDKKLAKKGQYRARHGEHPLWLVIHSDGSPWTAWLDAEDVAILVGAAQRHLLLVNNEVFDRAYWLDCGGGRVSLHRIV